MKITLKELKIQLGLFAYSLKLHNGKSNSSLIEPTPLWEIIKQIQKFINSCQHLWRKTKQGKNDKQEKEQYYI